jgi:Zn-dependent protease with chaperone function
METANRLLPRLCVFFGLVLFPMLLAAPRARAHAFPQQQTRDDDDASSVDERPFVDLMLEVDCDRCAKVTFEYPLALREKYNFRTVLSNVLGCPLTDVNLSPSDYDQSDVLSARCILPLRRSQFVETGNIDLQPFKDIQKAEPNIPFVVTLLITRQDFLRCNPEPEHLFRSSKSATCLYTLNNARNSPATLRPEFGYSRAQVLRLTGILGSLLLTPIALTFWFRRRAVTAPDEAKPALSFAHRRFVTWTALLGVLLWWAAVDLLRAANFISFLLPSGPESDASLAAIFPWVLLWIPPVVVYFLCLVLSLPMQALRGTHYTQEQLLNQSFWAVGRFVFPVSLISFGTMEMFHSARLGVLLLAAGIVAGKIANRKIVRAYGIELHALTSGELRDRAFSLAQKAATTLRQLYVLPAERLRMANAFAHAAQNIFLTDYLVKHLSKAEVDAVVGHEIAHLQNNHLGRRMTVIFLAVFGFAFSAAFLEYWLPAGLPNGPIFYAILLLVFFFLSRRNEFAADAGSVKLTGDAEAMITALAKLTRLNTVPLQWSKLDEKLLTHPSTLRRIRRISHKAGISDARIADLLSESLIPPVETYTIPPTALPTGKLFSTQYKRQLSQRIAWTVILTTSLVPAVVALFAHGAHLEGAICWTVYALGVFLTIVANLVLLNFLPMLGVGKLEHIFRQKFRAEGASTRDSGGIFVSLAPDSGPRVYEGNWSWDLGFLSITDGQLCYLGEEARFVLRRDEITSIWLGPGPTGWFRTLSLYVSWADSAGRQGTFNLRPLSVRSMREMSCKTQLLARDLENWRQNSLSSTNPIFTSGSASGLKLGPPAFGQVTGMWPQTMVRGQFLAHDFLVNTVLATAVILLFGLGFPLFDDLSRSTDPADLHPALGGLYVLLVVWLVRFLVLLPYWRAPGENSSPDVMAYTAVTSKVNSGI